jgi:hypothetical protein
MHAELYTEYDFNQGNVDESASGRMGDIEVAPELSEPHDATGGRSNNSAVMVITASAVEMRIALEAVSIATS